LEENENQMDPLSVGLGIAGLLPLIAQAIRLCKGYCDGVSLAEASMGALLAVWLP